MQDVIVVVGWLLFFVGGIAFTGGGFILLVVSGRFNGRFNGECLIPVVIGGLLLWGAYESNPFVMAMK